MTLCVNLPSNYDDKDKSLLKMINGFIICTFGDEGPLPIQNTSSLDENQILKLCVIGMTLLSLGDSETVHAKLYGPIPVPATNLDSFAMTFMVAAESTQDARISRFGRISNIWILFDPKYRFELLPHFNELESALQEVIKTIHQEKDLLKIDLIPELEKACDAIALIKDNSPEVPAIVLENKEIPVEPFQEAIYIFKIDDDGILIPVVERNMTSLNDLPNLFLAVDTAEETIFIVTNEALSRRTIYLASKTATNLNAQQFKNKYQIHQVNDLIERKILFKKLENLLKTHYPQNASYIVR